METISEDIKEKYISGELSSEEKNRFEKILKKKPELQQELELHKRVYKSLKKKDKLELKRKLDKIHKSVERGDLPRIKYFKKHPFYLYAALMVIFIGIGYLAYNYIIKDNGPKTEYIAGNYEKSPLFETFLESGKRSAEFKIIAPDTSAVFSKKNKITFEWLTDSKEVFQLKILQYINKSNVILYEFNVVGNTNNFVLKENLKPGRYYWKLETDNDVLHIGYFIVK